jgi:hypothetical protein
MPAHPVLRPMAPLDGLALAEVLEVLVELFEAVDEAEAEEPVDVALDDPEDVGPVIGAVDCPAICARTAAEKFPVILSRVNLAEKAK